MDMPEACQKDFIDVWLMLNSREATSQGFSKLYFENTFNTIVHVLQI